MGGFPYVVAKALGLKDEKDILGNPVHKGFWLNIEPWIHCRSGDKSEDSYKDSYKRLKDVFSTFTDDEKDKIVKTVQEELIFFFSLLSDKEEKVWMIYPKAFDCKRSDPDVYGFFGKSGAARLQKDDFFSFSRIVASSGQNSTIAHVPERLLWAFVEEATNAVIYH
jgi:hypothetical protein